MTVAQLKRHMDRRFARLGKELQGVANKKDLRRFAAKKDLRHVATKDDLERFATKDDFREVTRRLDSLNAKMDSMFKKLGDDIHGRDSIFDNHERRIRDLEAQAGS